jgi:two-component system sensor histidine kinase UhpB
MVHCAVVTDINERIKSEDVVRRSEQHFRDLYDEGERTREELQRLSREMLRVQEAERTRISREIHDELGQMLTAISLNVNNIAKTVPSSLLKRDIQSVRQLLEQATDFIHRLSHQIHPGMLEDLGLVPALRYLLRSLKESAGMDVKLIVLGAAGKASLEQKAAMYRVAQESLTNVLKHAGTSRASVTVRNSAEAIELQVLDKGKGFTLSRMSGSEGTRLGLGLVGMRERVQSLGGMFVIRSRPGKGTSVRVRIPFDGRKHGRRTGS